jgi:subtilisin family serine protease
MVVRNDADIQQEVERLHAPVRRLMEVLQAHNCLLVAAAGNDSVFRGIERTPRWGPRIPALYDSVLGVAADTVRPAVPAPYSNRGEVPAVKLRDAVATLGGDLAPDGLSPRSGVIGVYSAKQFPPLLPPAPPAANTTGWAEWSGTSFATPIMSGIAANLWATRPTDNATAILGAINTAARDGAAPDVADLGVPAVPVRLTWLP